MTAPLNNQQLLSRESIEITPLITPEVNKKIRLLCLSLWGVTFGLCLGTAFCTRSYLPTALAPVALPFNWCAYPFKPVKNSNLQHDRTTGKIYQLIILNFFALLGLTAPFIFYYYLKPINNEPYSPLTKISLLVAQCASIGINFAVSRMLYLQENPETRLSVLKMVGSTSHAFTSLFGRANGIFSRNDNPSGAASNPDIPSINKITINDVLALRDSNRRFASIDLKFREFVECDAELKKSFNSHLTQSLDLLIQAPKLQESPDLADPVLNEYGQELMMAEYWLQTVESFRDFLYKNPGFAELLTSKFNASNIQNKDEILRFYGFK